MSSEQLTRDQLAAMYLEQLPYEPYPVQERFRNLAYQVGPLLNVRQVPVFFPHPTERSQDKRLKFVSGTTQSRRDEMETYLVESFRAYPRL